VEEDSRDAFLTDDAVLSFPVSDSIVTLLRGTEGVFAPSVGVMKVPGRICCDPNFAVAVQLLRLEISARSY
jgi:hypothetical protein